MSIIIVSNSIYFFCKNKEAHNKKLSELQRLGVKEVKVFSQFDTINLENIKL